LGVFPAQRPFSGGQGWPGMATVSVFLPRVCRAKYSPFGFLSRPAFIIGDMPPQPVR
jgi:hypothetical protein